METRRRPPSWNLSTKRIRLVVAYDGTDFCGWAPQRGQRTVHGTLTTGVRQVSGEENEIIGASRTDSGAHARGQTCHFDTELPIEPARWAYVINKTLPKDLRVVASDEVTADFHSRFSAIKRWYRYKILHGAPDPIRGRFAHWHWQRLDVDQMKQAAESLVGEHDFFAFSQQLDARANAVRTLFSIDVRPVRDEVWIDIVGTAFVRGMMRRISGSLMDIGRGNRPVEWTSELLQPGRNRRLERPPVLPACGLTLMKVTYGRHPRDHRFQRASDDRTDE